MSSRRLLSLASRPTMAAATGAATAAVTRRCFHATHSANAVVTTTSPLPARRPVGAFRGGLFGFLLGSTLAGASVYYYVLEEHKASNQMLTEDIYALQKAITRVSDHLVDLEEKVDFLAKKQKR